MSQENVDALRAAFEEWGKGNWRAGEALYDAHTLLVLGDDFPEAGRYIGTDGVRDYMLRFLAAWTETTMAAEELIQAGDSVVVAVHQRAVGRESGAPGEMRYFHVWTFRGQVATRIEFFRDRAEALEAVGLLE